MPTNRYSELLQERADLRREAEANLAEAEAAGRMDEKHRKADDKLNARLASVQAEIDQHEIRIAQQMEAEGFHLDEATGRWLRDQPAGTSTRVQAAPGPRYAQMFGAPRGAAGFRSMADFIAPIHRGAWDQRYEAMIGGPGDTSGSGILIPEQFVSEMMDAALEDEIVRPRAAPYPMNSETLRIGGFRVGDGGEPYGISASWTGAGQTITQATPKAGGVTLTANALKALLQITQEDLDDIAGGSAPTADQQISVMLPKGVSWHVDRACLLGTGAGQPQGILTSANPARVVVDAEDGQEGGTVIWENLTAMFSRMHPSSRMRGVWVITNDLIPSLLELSIPIGVAGETVPVLREDGSGGFTILTRPVIFTEKVPSAGTEGDVSFIDFTQYAFGMRRDVRLEKSMHAGFTTDSTYYRVVVRMDGKSRWTEPYSPANGGPTLSPFVVLAARS